MHGLSISSDRPLSQESGLFCVQKKASCHVGSGEGNHQAANRLMRAPTPTHSRVTAAKVVLESQWDTWRVLIALGDAVASEIAGVLPQLALAMISVDGVAASRRIATNLDVGVWLPSPVLSSGTNGLTSG